MSYKKIHFSERSIILALCLVFVLFLFCLFVLVVSNLFFSLSLSLFLKKERFPLSLSFSRFMVCIRAIYSFLFCVCEFF